MIRPPFSVKKLILDWRKRTLVQAREAPATSKIHHIRLLKPMYSAKQAHRPPPPDLTSIESHL